LAAFFGAAFFAAFFFAMTYLLQKITGEIRLGGQPQADGHERVSPTSQRLPLIEPAACSLVASHHGLGSRGSRVSLLV
jgi:hypothetical protein